MLGLKLNHVSKRGHLSLLFSLNSTPLDKMAVILVVDIFNAFSSEDDSSNSNFTETCSQESN